MKSRGFTLIELMIVVAIIAIIAAIAIPNLLRSRMAANESAAVAACKAFCTAENIYRRTDYNKDGILEYAQSLSGGNSLYENTAGAGDLALIDRSFAAAEGTPLTATPKAGYVFRVYNSERNMAGALISYMSNGRMTLGFALQAMAHQYDGSGRNSFQVNATGTIYEGDPGPVTSYIGNYDIRPNVGGAASWLVVE